MNIDANGNIEASENGGEGGELEPGTSGTSVDDGGWDGPSNPGTSDDEWDQVPVPNADQWSPESSTTTRTRDEWTNVPETYSPGLSTWNSIEDSKIVTVQQPGDGWD